MNELIGRLLRSDGCNGCDNCKKKPTFSKQKDFKKLDKPRTECVVCREPFPEQMFGTVGRVALCGDPKHKLCMACALQEFAVKKREFADMKCPLCKQTRKTGLEEFSEQRQILKMCNKYRDSYFLRDKAVIAKIVPRRKLVLKFHIPENLSDCPEFNTIQWTTSVPAPWIQMTVCALLHKTDSQQVQFDDALVVIHSQWSALASLLYLLEARPLLLDSCDDNDGKKKRNERKSKKKRKLDSEHKRRVNMFFRWDLVAKSKSWRVFVCILLHTMLYSIRLQDGTVDPPRPIKFWRERIFDFDKFWTYFHGVIYKHAPMEQFDDMCCYARGLHSTNVMSVKFVSNLLFKDWSPVKYLTLD